MWNFTGKTHPECESVRDGLECTTATESADKLSALGALLAQLPESQRQHVNTCEDCRIFADELLEVRSMFPGQLSGPQPGPFFMARVMASIAEREVQLQESETQTWAAVPRLAYRLSVLASLLLLIAGSWLYQRPAQQSTVSLVGPGQYAEGLVDGGAPAQDDLLVTAAGR